MYSKSFPIFFVLFWAFVCNSFLPAQLAPAIISGTVADETGGVLPGVSMTLTNLDTGAIREVFTNDLGTYRAPDLPLGNYEVQAMLTGFQTGIRRGIRMTVGRQAEVDFQLRVGEVSEEVVVTGEAPMIETRNATLSGLVDEQTIMDLPLNGRSFDQLVLLQAGVVAFNHSTSDSQGRQMKFSVGGQRWQSNKFYQDGIELNGGKRQADMPGSAAGLNLGVDAIREFRVITNNYSAEYGKRVGGIISTVTKSGTNEFHGTLFEFHRNDNLDARNFFDVDPENPLERSDPAEFKRNNFGFSIGGPIVPDKAFFFYNYEGMRDRLGQNQFAVVPDANARMGLLPDADGNLIDVGVTPGIQPYLAWWTQPNGRNFGDGSAESISAISRPTNEDFMLARIDYIFSDADSLFSSYTHSKADVVRPLDVPTFEQLNNTRNQIFALEEKHVFSPTLLNTARVGYMRSFIVGDATPLIDIDPSLEFIPGAGFGSINISGTTGGATTGINSVGGTTGADGQRIASNSFQFSDQVFWSQGRHSWQFGVHVQRFHMNMNALERKRGTFVFDDLEAFLTETPLQFSGAAPPGTTGVVIGQELDPNSARGYRETYFGAYIVDQFQMLPNLTFNLGFRWEFTTIPKEVNGRLASQVITETLPEGRFVAVEPFVGGPMFNSNKSMRGMGPRLAIAWDPFSDGKTSIRTGFGVFYEQITPGSYSFYNESVPPIFLRVRFDDPIFPQPFSGSTDVSQFLPEMQGIDPNLDVPTVLHYNFGVERQLTDNLVLKVHYAGSHGYHLITSIITNHRLAEIQPDGRRFFAQDAPTLQPAHARGRGDHVISPLNTFYNSFQLALNQRFTNGLRFQGAFTYSKSIDDGSNAQNSAARNSPARILDPLDVLGNRSLSAFDVRRAFVLNFTYELPSPAFSGIASVLLNGWQINGIATVTDGNPSTVKAGFNVSHNGQSSIGDRPDLAPGRDNNPVLGGPDKYFDPEAFVLGTVGFYGTLGRNTLELPGFANFDFSAVKSFAVPSVSEDFNVQLKFEFFNLFNRANFSRPSFNLFRSSGARRGSAGRISETTNTSRQIQIGVRIIF